MTEPDKLEYRAGYLIPVNSGKGYFNIERDGALIAQGGHFFCQGHLTAVVIEEQSKDEKYCFACYTVIKEGG